jgi:transposase InsO family protein
MAYSINPNLPKARALALKLLIEQSWPPQVVANKCGVHRSTVYRWKSKWLELNSDVQLSNFNRPTRSAGRQFRLAALRWLIPTLSSRPNYSPNAVPENVIALVIAVRQMLRRCAEVVWFHLTRDNGVNISLSSVRRILRRYQYINGRPKRVRPDNPVRPLVTQPGELAQVDTIHYVCPYTKRRRYAYTVIDLYSRMAYGEVHSHIRPGTAAQVVLRAQARLGFGFHVVQADNGLEFSRYFEQTLARSGIRTRHSRLGRPNDNAHIERFNRTIQDECLGRHLDHRISNLQIQAKLNQYLEFYNGKRVHLGLQLRTPAEMLQRS